MSRLQLRRKLRKAYTGAKYIAKGSHKLSPSCLRTTCLGLVTVTVLSIATTQAANAAAVRAGFTTNTLSRNDDGSTGLVNIGFTTNFFGQIFNQLYVNNNGNVTFDSTLPTYTPFNLTTTNRQIIAPFFADVDTRNPISREVTYGTEILDGRNAFGVNWIDVGYFSGGADKLNSFQLVLVDRGDTGTGNFDIEFNYDKIQWETGTASGGSGGLGGDSARVGYSNATGLSGTFFELPGSAVNGAFLDANLTTGLIYNRLNSNVDGRYVFTARNGVIIVPPPDDVPEPLTIIGTLTAAGFGVTLRRKQKQQQKATAS
ncbi:PEP-CTERM sorting domain-containing protein [Tolypothrix sp. PCC 7910]|uniref:PEP-CTERM sorting domain-containing protein n=1 Tax=Tolypothrix sp. PCC 7910 TaxID=2099387 RepID=UPI0014277FF6|nr:PEP-CTERM sorting domain-containing protein [Tolypothrix sp. PCC 7910]QIR36259.1 PEP-CTERM sorting domain-containing protein [Tolypothrix sp. PCC 7910]